MKYRSVFVLSVVFLSVVCVGSLHAEAAYQASDFLGQTGFGSTDSVLTSSGMNNPKGLALDPVNHRFFVSDSFNHRVLVFNLDSDNNLIDRVADHVLGQLGFESNALATTQSGMYFPAGLFYETTTSQLFVADGSNNRVLIFNLSNGITNGMDASYELGQPAGVGAFTTSVTATTQSGMSRPQSVLFDSVSSRLFVSDYSNNRILVFNLSGGITNGMDASYELGQPAGVGAFTTSATATTQSGVNHPYAMTYDFNHQHLFVNDDNNKRILVFNLSGGITNGMGASNVIGQPDFTTTPWFSASSTAVGYPEEFAYDSSNDRLFVGDEQNNRILIFALSSGITDGMPASALIGADDFDTAGGCNVSQTEICDPEIGMVYDSTNNRLWMTDNSNNRVLSFDFIKLPHSINAKGNVGGTYSSTAETTQRQGAVTYVLSEGSLPDGVTLNASTGALTGTPTTVGVSTFTITATDDNEGIGLFTDSKDYTINVARRRSSSSGGSYSAFQANFLAQQQALVTSSTVLSPGGPSDCLPAYLFSPSTGLPCTSFVPMFGQSAVQTCSITMTLKLTYQGNQVKCLQTILHITADGSFGPKTKLAVMNFQQAHGLKADGVVGPLTRVQLLK